MHVEIQLNCSKRAESTSCQARPHPRIAQPCSLCHHRCELGCHLIVASAWRDRVSMPARACLRHHSPDTAGVRSCGMHSMTHATESGMDAAVINPLTVAMRPLPCRMRPVVLRHVGPPPTPILAFSCCTRRSVSVHCCIHTPSSMSPVCAAAERPAAGACKCGDIKSPLSPPLASICCIAYPW